MEEFHALVHMDPGALTDAQRSKLLRVRSAISDIGSEETLVRAISVEDFQLYIDPVNPRLTVFGSVSRGGDVADLQRPSQFVEALRLDYDRSKFLQGGAVVDEMYVMEIPSAGHSCPKCDVSRAVKG